MSKKGNTKINSATNNKKSFGFLTIFVAIVGTVIGSGIFFKADSIYETTNSTIMSLVAWGIAGLLVIIIAIACIEIISSSKKTDESGTLSNWASKFISPKFGAFVGLFLVFIYMPLTIVPLAQYTTDYIASASTGESSFANIWMNVGITFGIFMLLSAINYFSNTSSKSIQVVGTFVKSIPILIILVSSIIVTATGASLVGSDSVDAINSVGKNEGLNESSSQIFSTLMIALPGVLYAYDGFIYAGSMQNETKKKGTFKKALISGIIFIALVYTILAVGLYGAGDEASGFSVAAVINTVFGEDVGKAMNIFVSITIVISISTGLNGFIMSGNRNFASLSETHLIKDENCELQKRDEKTGIPKKSARKLWLVGIVWFVLIYALTIIVSYSGGGMFNELIINTLAEISVILEFGIIAIILIGGLRNRKTNKVQVEKSKLFIPAAVISIVSILFLVVYQFLYYFIFSITAGNGDWQYYLPVGILTLVSLIGLGLLTSYQTRKMNERYDGKWTILCEYTSNLKAESLENGSILDFDEMLENKNELIQIKAYEMKKEVYPPFFAQKQYVAFMNSFKPIGDANYKMVEYCIPKINSISTKMKKTFKPVTEAINSIGKK